MIYKNKDKSRVIIKDSEVQSSLFDSTGGGSLENALKEQDKRIGKLEGNVKWLYAYGGVGGTGGGGEDTSSWGYYVLLQPYGSDVFRINDNSSTGIEPAAVNKGMATLTLGVRNPGDGVSYSVTVRYDGITYPSSIVLSPSNSWRVEINIELTKNSSLYIEYVNQSTLSPLSMTYNYVVNPFVMSDFIFKPSNIDDQFVYDNTTTNIYLEDIIAHGIIATSQYTCNLSGEYFYEWTIDTDKRSGSQVVSINDVGFINTDLTDYLTTSTSTTHNITFFVKYRQKNTTSFIEFPLQKRTINIITSEKTLAINPADGLYDNMEIVPPESMMKNNNNAFTLQFSIFYGVNKGRRCHINLKSEQVGYMTTVDHGIYQINSREFWGISETATTEEIKEILKIGTRVAGFDDNGALFYYTLNDNDNPFALNSWVSSAYEPTPDTSIDFNEGEYPSISITPVRRASGWCIMVCDYTIGGEGDRVIKFFYDKVVETSFDWWPSSLESIANKMVMRRVGNGDTTVTAMTSTSQDIIYESFSPNELDINYVLNVGIQYNETSDVDKPIITIETVNTESKLVIYQNRVQLGSQEFSIFVDKIDSEIYSINNLDNFHMLSIVNRVVKGDGRSGTIYEVAAYMDGVLQGVLENLPDFVYKFVKLTLKPGNYIVNNLELDYFPIQNGVTNCYFDDYITYYYYTYKIKMYNRQDIINSNSRGLLNYLVNLQADKKPKRENGLIKVDQSFVSNLMQFADRTPTLVVSLSKETSITTETGVDEFSVFDWMNDSYTESTEGEDSNSRKNYKYPIRHLYWVTEYTDDWSLPGNDVFKNSRLYTDAGDSLDGDFSFYLKLQGTSTMGNKDKNFTVGLNQPLNTETSNKRLFSPNFYYNGAESKMASEIFLPEASFTLKADHVDSSHTNNVCMGNFVNEHTSDCLSPGINTNDWFQTMIGDNVDNNQRRYLKRCLTGFPYYMVLETYDTLDNKEYYYLGVYNFNLGRSSEYNLGYRNLSSNVSQSVYSSMFSEQSSGRVSNGFTFISSSSDNSYNPGLVVGEVQGNTPMWDFSQFDDKVLFKNDGVQLHMFDDIVSSVTNGNAKIQEFVSRIAFAGGYIWSQLNKRLEPINPSPDGTSSENYYNIPGTVPTYKRQYTYSGSSYVWYDITREASSSDLQNLLFDDQDTNHTRWVEYDSLNAYYSVCMGFGMVDSVQKNLCIKTWNANANETKFGAFFYDMDTCLGIDNQGNDSGYFCFSDFYKTKAVPSGVIDVDGVEHDVYDVNTTTILRDFWPSKPWAEYDITAADYSQSGYDIPSSYLWAIAKYAFSLNRDKLANPCDYWAKWRSVGNILETPDSFIENYFIGYTRNTSEAYWNLNYREKYLSVYGDDWRNDVSSENHRYHYATSLKGRRFGYVREWLSKRFDIMDLYMNMTRITSNTLSDAAVSNNVIAPYYTIQGLQFGDNVQINKCITTAAVGEAAYVGRNAPVELVVNSGDYSPLVVRKGGNYFNYILSDSSKYYRIKVSYSGAEQSSFGGSRRWLFIESLAPLLKTMSNKDGSFTIISKNLDNIIIEDNETLQLVHNGTFNFNTPKVHTIKLTSTRNNPEFGGSLIIDSSKDYQALKTVNIDGSKISLNINGDGLDIVSVSANGIKSASELVLKNLDAQKTELNINNAEADKMEFTTWSVDGSIKLGYVTSDSSFINIKPQELYVTAKPGTSNATLDIRNISSIKKLSFKGFKTVSITGCSKLEIIECADQRYDQVPTPTPILESYTLNGSIVKTLTLNNCNILKRLNLSQNPYLKNLVIYGQEGLKPITYLNVSNTSISNIKWNNIESQEIDLRWCSQNVEFLCSNNASVEYVRCYNNRTSPMTNIGDLSSCSLLKRVYGHFLVKSNMFYRCYQFSLHGSETSEATWNGENVMDSNTGRVKPPYEIISGDVNDYVSPSISGSSAYNYFSEYNDATNIALSNDITNAFRGTKSTIFDIYYTLWMIGVYENCTNLSIAWYESQNTYKFNSQTNNNPNINMFRECGGVTSMSHTLRGYNNGIVHLRDELFTPLTSLTNISYCFHGWTFACSQNIFTRNTELTNVGVFSPIYVLGDYNESLSYEDLSSVTNLIRRVNANGADNFGVFGNILKENNKITYMSYFFRNCYYLKYKSSYTDIIPSGVTALLQVFNSTYADGEFPTDLSVWFKNPAGIEKICSSFMATSEGPETEDVDLLRGGVTLTITNNLFNGFVNLTHISYDGSDNGAGGDNNFWLTNDFSYKSAFCGNGVNKIIPVDINGNIIFPYNIFTNCNRLSYITGLFSNSKPGEGYENVVMPSLPGNMFANTPNLVMLDFLFANVQFDYTLSSIAKNNANFSGCRNLSSIKYMFANDTVINYTSSAKRFLSTKSQGYSAGESNPQKDAIHLHSSIPYKFFYHGEDVSSKTYHGTNEEPVIDSGGTPTYSGDTDAIVTFAVPRTTISNMEGCFMSCDLDWYNYENEFINEDLRNPDYIPFKYYQSNGIWTERKNDGVEDVENTVKWIYDGDWDYSNSGSTIFATVQTAVYELNKLEDVIRIIDAASGHTLYSSYICTMSDSETSNSNKYFCTPPDLFRYCSSDCNIDYLFYHSGCNSLTWSNIRPDMTYGLHGRLCPWLMTPLSRIERMVGMFSNCKRLLTYGYNNNYPGYLTANKYFIPTTFFKNNSRLNNISYMFDGICLSNNTLITGESFSGINQRNSLNVSYTFYGIRHGDHNVNNTTGTEFRNLFTYFNISNCKACFAQLVTSGDYSGRPQGYVNFSSGNFKSSYASPVYASSDGFSYVYCAYTNARFYPYNSSTACRDLPSNTTTFNYYPLTQ